MSDRALDYVVRQVVTRVADLFPPEKTRNIERWVRGREECRRLEQADYAVVSAGKSGRTWLNVMLSKYFQRRFDLPDNALFSFDNLHEVNAAIPKVLFTHDNYIRDYNRAGEKKTAFYDTPTILLVRHPADTAVSLFFHWRHRMQPRKKRLNQYPPHGADISVFDFVMHDSVLPSIVRFTNEWARELPQLRAKIVVRYEDLRAETPGELGRLLHFMGQDPTDVELDDAVAFASFENLKKLEAEKAFARGTRRLTAGDNSNPDSFKVRRAKVGGYRDYFTDEEVAQIETYIRTRLEPGFGYDVVPS